MATQHFIQIECISVEQFKSELLTEIKQLLETFNSLQTEQDEILSREQTAELLKISLVTLWKWTNNDIIPAYRIGKKVLYKKSEVLASLKPKNRFNF
jgi:excisionase family DNA binding protein